MYLISLELIDESSLSVVPLALLETEATNVKSIVLGETVKGEKGVIQFVQCILQKDLSSNQ